MRPSEIVLKQYFGFESFRQNQQQAVEAVLDGQDVFVLMPTGGGKSLCYSIPSVVMPGVTIVISPLISLMKDQVDALRHNGISAAYLNSSLDDQTQQDIINQVLRGDISMLYIAPERLVQPHFLNLLSQLNINFFAIDEAHCISQWGHDFRTEYRQLSMIRQQFAPKPIMALTATATDRVKADIVTQLSLRQPQVLVSSFFRPNLTYSVQPKQQVKDSILQYVLERPGEAGIIYCQSRSNVEKLASFLQEHGVKAATYHAGLSDEDRASHQEQFKNDEVQIITATVAFGMGIDKSNVRFVLHESAPRSLEHYYQESGRAGRDGQPSQCVMYFSSGDLQLYRQFNQSLPPAEQDQANLKLGQVQRFAMSSVCRHHQLLEYFSEQSLNQSCSSCDNCLTPRQTFDATVLTQKVLSCVYRLGRPYSPTYITKILTGKSDEQIERRQHNQLSVFGIIADYKETQLRQVLLELSEQGYVTIDLNNYNGVSLTQDGLAVLKGQRLVELSDLFLPQKAKVKPARFKTGPSAAAHNQQDVDQELFEALRQLRKQIAAEEAMPPYIIFADTSLTDMAIQRPTALDDFSKIYGVGQQKLDKYGPRFIEVVKKHSRNNEKTM